MDGIATVVDGAPYRSYLYAYPHKNAYRRLDPPIPLGAAWADEDRSALFLYLHVPFCEMRCGFCNLFTLTRPKDALVEAWLAALERQVGQLSALLGDAVYARVAVGGGTPTFLTPPQLERAFDLLERMAVDLRAVPFGIEVSPGTTTPDRLAVLRARGVDRVSIGIQSFAAGERRAAQRPEPADRIPEALDRIRAAGFPVLNVDLIYGIDGQTRASWLASLERALEWSPEEIYLYPLYVRPLTGLGRTTSARDAAWDELRSELYRAGRDHLRERGYDQVSMRMFRKAGTDEIPGPIYRCQQDGMVGLGCGARSYTRALHWSSEYAVRSGGVREIVEAYAGQERFGHADWGFQLDEREQRHRYLVLSLLAEGVDRATWRARFGTGLDADFPQLGGLARAGLATDDGAVLALTDAGVERSDAIGPWLQSERVQALIEACEVR